jgi:hypothetical protein
MVKFEQSWTNPWWLLKQIIKKLHIKVINNIQNHIHDVVAIETNVVIMPFGVILTYAIVLNSPIKTKQSNDN